MANMEAKNEVGYAAHQVETLPCEDEKKTDLDKMQTLGVVDIENRIAFKNDDSDGSVNWGFKSLAAAFFLCSLYNGTTKFSSG